jgi:hypothetical protein
MDRASREALPCAWPLTPKFDVPCRIAEPYPVEEVEGLGAKLDIDIAIAQEPGAKWHAAFSIKWLLPIAGFRKTLYLKLQQACS